MTTKRSYEDQLSMMSDHLCSMNETLTKQREEIDTLKMTSKVSWQGWHGALAAAGAGRVTFGVPAVLPLGKAAHKLEFLLWASWKENSKLAPSGCSEEKNSCKTYMWERTSSSWHFFTLDSQSVPSDGRSYHFMFKCGENGTICKSRWWGSVVMVRFWVEVSLLHSFWLQHTLSLATALFLSFISIF